MSYKVVLPTTEDNPFNPFTQFDEWFAYDHGVLGYNTLEKINRVSEIPTNYPVKVVNQFIIDNINELKQMYPFIPFTTVEKEESDDVEQQYLL